MPTGRDSVTQSLGICDAAGRAQFRFDFADAPPEVVAVLDSTLAHARQSDDCSRLEPAPQRSKEVPPCARTASLRDPPVMTFDFRRLLGGGDRTTPPRVQAAGPFDPRIPRAAYERRETYGQRMNVLVDAIHDACPTDDVRSGWDRLPEAHRALFVVYWATAETYNGSLDQYFWNSAGDFASLLPAAARFFGSESYAALFERAIALFDPARLPNRKYRQDRLIELETDEQLKVLDGLDDEFYALEDAGDIIWAAITEYIDAHPEVFFSDAAHRSSPR